MNTITQEQALDAYRRAPQLVRDTFNAEATTQVIIEIKEQYGLHIDMAGVVGKQVGYLLLGLVTPSQFLGGLLSAGIQEPEARQIMGEINEKIFKPLQEEMRKGAPPPPPPPQPPVPAPPRPIPSPRPAPPPPQAFVPPPPPRVEPSITLPPIPAQVRPAQPPPLGRSDLPNSAPLPPRTVLPGASAPVFHHPMPPPLGGVAGDPERSRGTAPPNLPTGEAPIPSTPDASFNPLPPLARPPATPPPRAPYPSDPYHEPIE